MESRQTLVAERACDPHTGDKEYRQYLREHARHTMAQELYKFLSERSLNKIDVPIYTVAICEGYQRNSSGMNVFRVEARLERVRYNVVNVPMLKLDYRHEEVRIGVSDAWKVFTRAIVAHIHSWAIWLHIKGWRS